MVKKLFKLSVLLVFCFTMSSCYWDDVMYVGGKPYLFVNYPEQKGIDREGNY